MSPAMVFSMQVIRRRSANDQWQRPSRRVEEGGFCPFANELRSDNVDRYRKGSRPTSKQSPLKQNPGKVAESLNKMNEPVRWK